MSAFCYHRNQVLKVTDSCVTCETTQTICTDCGEVLSEETEC